MGGGTTGKLQPQVGDTAGAGLKYLLINTYTPNQVCNYSITFYGHLVYMSFSTEIQNLFCFKRNSLKVLKVIVSGLSWTLELTGSGL